MSAAFTDNLFHSFFLDLAALKMVERTIYKIAIPNTLHDGFDYQADISPTSSFIGCRVWVPFRQKKRIGIVVSQLEQSHYKKQLKPIIAVIDETPLLSASMLALAHWVSDYYQSPLSEVLALMLPKAYRTGDNYVITTPTYYALAITPEKALALLPANASRQRDLILFLAKKNQLFSQKELNQHGFNSTTIHALLKRQILYSPATPPSSPPSLKAALPLTSEQQQALEAMRAHLDTYRCFLLEGVTGSGKTEVYLQLIAIVLAQKKQVLVLVPEIGLTPQLLHRFKERFSETIGVIHSHLSEKARFHTWEEARQGTVRLLIGTRSAVFTPLPQLGLIIIDEEHDSSLKQLEGVRYFARDTALKRAYDANIPIVLGSATPSLESLANSRQQKYHHLRLTHKAVSTTPLHYQVIDVRQQSLQHGLAAKTLSIINTHLVAGNQVLVFINRRGYAPILLCHTCGWIADCKACASHLTWHRQTPRLQCHHCGLAQRLPVQCPHCHQRTLQPLGTGTQRIEDVLIAHFPDKTIARIDRDNVKGKKALDDHLAAIVKGEAQLIIGTQLLAKGHHFPRLTLVVIVDVDQSFYSSDFRAMERFGQLITQVSGRAGRETLAGEVVLQTHLPHHPLLMTLIQQGYPAFANRLLQARHQAVLPPYSFLALIRAQSKNAHQAIQWLHQVKSHLSQHPHLTLLGPAPAPLEVKAHQHRWQLLIKSPSRHYLQAQLTALRAWLTKQKLTTNLRWSIDVDPQDLS